MIKRRKDNVVFVDFKKSTVPRISIFILSYAFFFLGILYIFKKLIG